MPFSLSPAGRFAHLCPIQLCPACVSFAGYVLPSSPSPCSGLSPPPITTLDTTPAQPGFLHFRFGHPSLAHKRRLPYSSVSRFPVRASLTACRIREGVKRASQVLVCISSYMPRLENSAGPSHPRLLRMILYCLRRTLQPSATGTASFRSDTSTSGSAVSPTAYMILCVRFTCFVRPASAELRHRCNTRYGRAANPYPTGTFTLQDAPSCAWRANEYAEKSSATCMRMRPIRFSTFHLSTAIPTMVLPSAPRPLLPDFWPPIKNSSTSTRPESFSRSWRIVHRLSFWSQLQAVA